MSAVRLERALTAIVREPSALRTTLHLPAVAPAFTTRSTKVQLIRSLLDVGKRRRSLDSDYLTRRLVRNQDDELNLRLIREGGTIWQSPKIRCWYHPRSSLRALFSQYAQYGFWKVRVIKKHGRWLRCGI